MKLLTATILFISGLATAQPLAIKKDHGGLVSFGVRTTISTFNSGEFGNNGLGLGGQCRVQFAEQVNSDWFFDYIQGNVGNEAFRTDYHIGWSVIFYPTKKFDSPVRPYILAGHCFDYTRLVDNSDRDNFMERWSSAVQGGAGVHFNLTPRLDLSVVGQYMVHMGTDIHAQINNGKVLFREEKGASLEGHLLFHVGINYKIADLW